MPLVAGRTEVEDARRARARQTQSRSREEADRKTMATDGQVAAAGEFNMLDMVEEFSKRGNQIFVALRKGKEYPPTCCDVRWVLASPCRM